MASIAFCKNTVAARNLGKVISAKELFSCQQHCTPYIKQIMSKKLEQPFWQNKTMQEMTEQEWESLCDGCAQCCVYKTEDEETGEIEYSTIACPLLNIETCKCSKYETRQQYEPECATIRPENAHKLSSWLPKTCAYRLLAEERDLPPWHPLITGNPDSTKNAGMSVRNRVMHAKE